MSENTTNMVKENVEIMCDKDPNKASPSSEGIEYIGCEFKKSDFYQNIKYPLYLMSLSCIYIPARCVCEITKNSDHNSGKHIWRTEETNTKRNRKVSVAPVLEKQVNSRIKCHRCPNSDNVCLAMLKKACCVVIIIAHCTNSARYTFILKNTFGDTDTFVFSLLNFFIQTSYFYNVAFNSYACARYFTPFITAFFKYDIKHNRKRPYRKYVVIFWVLIMLQCFQFALIASGVLVFLDGYKNQTWPFLYMNFKGARIITAIGMGFGIFLAGNVAFGTIFLQGAIVSVLHKEFKTLSEELCSILRNCDETCYIEDAFDNFVQKYRNACDLMNKAHTLIRHIIAATYIFSTPELCLVLYALISDSIKTDKVIAMTLVAAIATFILAYTTWLMASLRSQVFSACDAVYEIDWCRFSPLMLQKITLFTNMFHTKTLGMTVYGMFVIDWSTLLMVGGTLLTYGLVVIQFNIDSGTPVCRFGNMTF